MLKHVTITLTDEVFRWAKLKAAGENTSLSRLVGRMLEEQMRMTDEYRKAGVLIECLTKQGFDDGLTAHVEAGGAFIEFPQHALRQVYVFVKNRETSTPRVAVSAISSAEGGILDLHRNAEVTKSPGAGGAVF